MKVPRDAVSVQFLDSYVRLGAKPVARIGLSMVITPPCARCGQRTSLMYGIWWLKSKKPLVACCHQCYCVGGFYGPLLKAFVKRARRNLVRQYFRWYPLEANR